MNEKSTKYDQNRFQKEIEIAGEEMVKNKERKLFEKRYIGSFIVIKFLRKPLKETI